MQRKIYLSIISFTFTIWTLALIVTEYKLLTLADQLSSAKSNSLFDTSSLFSDVSVPWYVHLLIISVIASLITWLLANYKELFGFYSKQIDHAKRMTNSAANKISDKTK